VFRSFEGARRQIVTTVAISLARPSTFTTPPSQSTKMSNTQVGNVYQQIIADVVDSSRVDFEEGGVDEHVLDELRIVSWPLFLFSSNASSQIISSMPVSFRLRVFAVARVLASLW